MSELLTAAAAALGAPEDLVGRSAAARAVADGTSEEAVLAAWSGGTALPDPQPSPPVTASPEATPEAVPTESPAQAPVTPAAPAVSTMVIPARKPSAAPVLAGQQGRPLMALLGIAALFVVGVLITLIIPGSTGGDYLHLVPDAEISPVGQAGLDVYLEEGCWYCHTQLVRPVLADVGLGPVTETFSDPLDTAAFGVQRIGPDLAHIGSRMSFDNADEPLGVEDLEALLTDPHLVFPDGLHPSYTYLSDTDLSALTTYLLELK